MFLKRKKGLQLLQQMIMKQTNGCEGKNLEFFEIL